MSDAAAKPRLVLNAAANGVGFVVQLALAFVLSPLLIQGLGDARNGIWSLVESILAYLLLFDLGVAAALVRAVARFETNREGEALNRIFSTCLCLFGAAGLLAFGVTLGLAFPVWPLLRVPADLAEEARWMLVLLGANLAVGLPCNVFSCVLDGLGRYPAKTLLRTGVLLARLPLFLGVLWTGGGLRELAWAITVCNVMEHALMGAAAFWYLPELRFSVHLVDRETFRAVRGISVNAFLAMLAGRVSFQTDALVIGAFLSPAHITFFAVGGRLVEYAKNALRAVTTVLAPAFSTLEARGDNAGTRRLLLDGTRAVLWLIVPIEAGLLLLGKPFLSLWMGPRYAVLSYPTLAILAVPLTLAMSQSVAVRVLYGTGNLRWFARLVLAEAVCNLLLSIALAGPLGIEGVALGTSLPNVLANLALVAHVCRLSGVRFVDYVAAAWVQPCVAGLVLAGGWWLAATLAPPQSWTAWLAVGLAGALPYLVLAAWAEGLLKRLLRLGVMRGPRPAARAAVTIDA